MFGAPRRLSLSSLLLMLRGSDTSPTRRLYIIPLAPLSEWRTHFEHVPNLRAVPLPSLSLHDSGFSIEFATARLVPKHLFALAVPPETNPYTLHRHAVPSSVAFFEHNATHAPSPVAVASVRRLARHGYVADLALVLGHDRYLSTVTELLAPASEDGEREHVETQPPPPPPPYHAAQSPVPAATVTHTPSTTETRAAAYGVTPVPAVVSPWLDSYNECPPLSAEEVEEVRRAAEYCADMQYIADLERDEQSDDASGDWAAGQYE